jgi:hypothetical protein
VFFAITQLFAVTPAAATGTPAAPGRSRVHPAARRMGDPGGPGDLGAGKRYPGRLPVVRAVKPAAARRHGADVVQGERAHLRDGAGGLLAIDCVAILGVSRLFDRERLVTGTRA